MSNEQKLINIMFEIALTIQANTGYFQVLGREKTATWVAEQLKDCGFNTIPIGSSWGVLTDE